MAALTRADITALRDEVAALRRNKFEDHGLNTIPLFSGGLEDLGNFLDMFDVSAVAYGWNEMEKCQRFPLYLRDHALDISKTIDPLRKLVLAEMLDDFKAGITTSDVTKMFGCQLRARKQRPNETAALFASRLKHLGQQAYPTLTDAQRDPILRDCFFVRIAARTAKPVIG